MKGIKVGYLRTKRFDNVEVNPLGGAANEAPVPRSRAFVRGVPLDAKGCRVGWASHGNERLV